MEDNENNNENGIRKVEEIVASTRILSNIGGTDLQEAEERVWRKLSSELSASSGKTKKRVILWRYWSVAASIVLFVLSGTLFYFSQQDSSSFPEMSIVCTAGEDGKRQVTLPDGTLVWLNAGTQLVYPEKFTSRLREVFITGEAFFDVVKDAKRPFIVKSDAVNIKVVGTRFNMKSYQNEDVVEIVLEKGSVSFCQTNEELDNFILLHPDERAEISKTTGKVTIAKIDAGFYTSWRDGKLQFKAQTLGTIMTVLEKVHNVKIKVTDEKLKQEIYTGKFENGETVEQILDIIKLNTHIKYSYKNGVYIISDNK